MKSKSIDIKSLTAELRNISKQGDGSGQRIVNDPNKKMYGDRSLGESMKNQAQKSYEANRKSTSRFLEIVRDINAKDQYQIDKFIYVDSDIHEVFTKLKTHTKLKLSYLASHLLEEFFIEHKDSIKEIISQKQNKFLDK